MISSSLPGSIIGTTIGSRIPNVPHDVPVANARNIAIQNTITGISICTTPLLPSSRPATNTSAPKRPVTPLSVHANVRIRIAGTIALKPSGRQSINSLKRSTLRGIYSTNVISRAAIEPSIRPVAESQFANASTKLSPSKKPPV